jgi:hypothetical protein
MAHSARSSRSLLTTVEASSLCIVSGPQVLDVRMAKEVVSFV